MTMENEALVARDLDKVPTLVESLKARRAEYDRLVAEFSEPR